jgi:rare lipoprotein A
MRGVIQKDPSFGATRALMVILCAGVGLAACATAAPRPHYVVSGPPTSSAQPPNPSGLHGTMAPYQVNGRWYTPHAEPGYDVVGVASWYGQQFHNHRTANGEIFDQNAVSAAHTTLPIPSIIEVTNLANNKSIRVRLNDRGPFVDGRILDLSREAAAELGYEREGVARVRIRYIGPAPALPTVRLAANGAREETARHEREPHQAGEIADQDFPSVAGSNPRGTAPVETADIEDGPQPTAVAPVAQAAHSHVQTLAPRDSAGAGSGGYAVQVGAYSSRETADRIAARLADAGSISIEPIQRHGAVLYKLKLGAFPDAQSAAAARARVAAAGLPDARVVGPQ